MVQLSLDRFSYMSPLDIVNNNDILSNTACFEILQLNSIYKKIQFEGLPNTEKKCLIEINPRFPIS